MSPKRNLENRTRADAREVNVHKSKSKKRFHWTPAVWLQLIEAVEQFDNQKSTNWDVVAETLPPDFMKIFASVTLAANSAKVRFSNFRWQVENPGQRPRYATGVTDKVVQKMKDYGRTRKGKVDRVVDCDAFETFSTKTGTGQEMSVDQQEGFPADAEENNLMVGAQLDGGLDSREDSQSFQTAPQSFFNKDPSDFESFFGEYDLVANEIFCPMNIQNFIQNGKNRARERMNQELGIQRFKALLEPSSWSTSQAPREASFIRFQTGIVRAVESCTDTLIDQVIKEVVIRELRKEE